MIDTLDFTQYVLQCRSNAHLGGKYFLHFWDNLELEIVVSVSAGVIAFTDGVSGFNSSSSMHATITEMRTNNISCWIFRAGSRDTASWG